MQNILNITNGDSTVEIMTKADIPGVYLPWRDVLHEGPVPEGLALEALSTIRAHYIAEQGWGSLEKVKADFVARDETLKSYREYSKVVLWFEHDLYDQLQILQILAWFADQADIATHLTIICTDQYLGTLNPDELSRLFRFEKIVTQQHLAIAKTAWNAFRSDTPHAWLDLLHRDTSILPFLQDTVKRMLQEYPNPQTGLPRIQYQALQIAAKGEFTLGQLFTLYQDSEQHRFLGDLIFWSKLQPLINSNTPLLKLSEKQKLTLPVNPKQKLTLTQLGLEVLHGEQNWLELQRSDSWLGGVHLCPENNWLWDTETSRLIRSKGN